MTPHISALYTLGQTKDLYIYIYIFFLGGGVNLEGEKNTENRAKETISNKMVLFYFFALAFTL